jgi:SAM-dependent methyltransferase
MPGPSQPSVNCGNRAAIEVRSAPRASRRFRYVPVEQLKVISSQTANRGTNHYSMHVLQSRDEITGARKWIRDQGFDLRRDTVHWFRARLRYLIRHAGLLRVDETKSWDVETFAKLIIANVSPDALIVDMGSVASELPWVLHLAGYRKIVGCDLSPRVMDMPFGGQIDYRVGDIASLGLSTGSVACITAVSVIEHGVDVDDFLTTASRLLRPGGLLCMSTDYWPERIPTDDVRIFGLRWEIFDASAIRIMVERAAEVGFEPVLEDIPEPPAQPVISWSGRNYTFLAMPLRKRRS